MKKKMISLILTLTMLLSLIPVMGITAGEDEESYPLIVIGDWSFKYNEEKSEYTWYDEDTDKSTDTLYCTSAGVLSETSSTGAGSIKAEMVEDELDIVLTNVALKNSLGICYEEEEVIITLVGENSIAVSDLLNTSGNSASGIFSSKSELTITGSGSLDITLKDNIDGVCYSYGIDAYKLTVDGCTVTATSGEVEVSGGGSACSYGIFAPYFTIKNDAVVIATGKKGEVKNQCFDAYSIGVSVAFFTMESGRLIAHAEEAYVSDGTGRVSMSIGLLCDGMSYINGGYIEASTVMEPLSEIDETRNEHAKYQCAAWFGEADIDSAAIIKAGDDLNSLSTITQSQLPNVYEDKNLCKYITVMVPVPTARITKCEGNTTLEGQKYATLAEAITAAENNEVSIQLKSDTDEKVSIANGQTVNLDLNGYGINYTIKEEGENVITVASGGTLSITDSDLTATTHKVHYYKVASTGNWKYLSETPETIDYDYNNGVMKEHGTSTDYAGIPAEDKVIAVTGGCISAGCGDHSSGTIILNSGDLYLKGGSIIGAYYLQKENPLSCQGGGVENSGTAASFTMSGGSILGNLAYNGGGVHGSTFTMEGGTVAYNVASDVGGGISIGWGEINLIGGKITCNFAKNSGGGTYFKSSANGALINISNEISNNTAFLGGGICACHSMKINLGNGTRITGNSAHRGGGIAIGTRCEINLSGDAYVMGNTNTITNINDNLCIDIDSTTPSYITSIAEDFSGTVGVHCRDENNGALTEGVLSSCKVTSINGITSDYDAYKLIINDDNHIAFASRLLTQPSSPDYTVGIDTEGLGDKLPTYQWNKLEETNVEPDIWDDLVENIDFYAYDETTKAYSAVNLGGYCIVLVPKAAYSFIPSITFDVETMGDDIYYDEDNNKISTSGTYTVQLVYIEDFDTNGILLSSTKPFTIKNVKALMPQKVENQTTQTLTSGKKGEQYFCVVEFADGSVISTNTVELATDVISAAPCTYTAPITAGEAQTLILGGVQAGVFTIEGSSCKGYTLRNSDGEYLALVNNEVKAQNKKFTWKYDGGLYAETKTTCRTGFGCRSRTATKVTRQYLSFDGEKFVTSSRKVCARVQITAKEHTWAYLHDGDGSHEAYCTKCGHHEDPKEHQYDENGRCVCGKLNPKLCYVSGVGVREKKTTFYSGFLFWTRKITKYQYTIKPETKNIHVSKVEYSINNRHWEKGAVIVSEREIKKLYIRITDANGTVTKWIYQNNKVTSLDKE